MRPWVRDVSVLLNAAMKDGKSILFEGAQGTLLDIDHGTYPYVTSSNASVGGVCTGLGIPPKAIGRVLGVAKAYTTRVGEGTLPDFPSDMLQLARCEPVYESMPGWTGKTAGVRRLDDLPEGARRYVAKLEEVSGVRAAVISTGSERDDTILRDDVIAPFESLRAP